MKYIHIYIDSSIILSEANPFQCYDNELLDVGSTNIINHLVHYSVLVCQYIDLIATACMVRAS